ETAAAMRELGYLAQAEQCLEAAIGRFPEHPGLAREHAQLAMQARAWPEALRRWKVVQARFPESPAGYVGEGIVLLNTRRFDEAEMVLAGVRQRFPQDISVALNYARTAELKADWREALARWKDLVAKFPAHPIGQIGTGRALRWLGHYDESDALLSSLAARHPDEKDIPIEQAELAFARGDWT